jgi:putative aminopeptidase FrvX
LRYVRTSTLLCLMSFSFAAFAQGPAKTAPTDRAEALLQELSNAPGISGHEDAVRAIVLRELKAAGADTSTDGLGSAIGVLQGPAGAPRIMLAAHMDELGLLVKHITADGFIKVLPLGGWLDQALIDKRWIIHTSKGPIPGTSGLKTIHITTADEKSRVFPREQIFIDIGARNQADAEAMGVRPGDAIVPDVRFERMGASAYVGKALDDRVGVAVMLEAMRRLSKMNHPNTIYAVGTVQEEVGTRGGHTSSQAIKPDLGIAVEVGVAGDYPGTGPDQAQEKLGAGPGIFIHDSSMLPNRKLSNFFRALAQEKAMPLQTELLTTYGEDASEIQRHAAGTPTINFTVPVRYLHTFNSVIRREDFDRAVDLLVEALMRLDAKTVSNIKSFD